MTKRKTLRGKKGYQFQEDYADVNAIREAFGIEPRPPVLVMFSNHPPSRAARLSASSAYYRRVYVLDEDGYIRDDWQLPDRLPEVTDLWQKMLTLGLDLDEHFFKLIQGEQK